MGHFNTIANAQSFKRHNAKIPLIVIPIFSQFVSLAPVLWKYACDAPVIAASCPQSQSPPAFAGSRQPHRSCSLQSPRSAKSNLTRPQQHLCARPTSQPEQSHADVDTMAAAIKALNAKIRSNPVLDYFCSTRESQADLRGGLVARTPQRIALVGSILRQPEKSWLWRGCADI